MIRLKTTLLRKVEPKVSYFFFTRIRSLVIHSFKSKNRVFFYFREAGKKKYKLVFLVFFYFHGKVHRPFIRILSNFSFFEQKIIVFFFYRFFWCFCVFFFFPEKFICHSFIQFLRPEKKTQPGKKTAFSFIQSISLKSAQKRTYPGK